jgi:hypothetical protein
MKKLRAHWTVEMAVIIRSGIVFPLHFQKIWSSKYEYTELYFWLLFRMGMKLGLSHWGRNIGCGCSRTGRPKRDNVNRGLQENVIWRASWFVLRTKYHPDDQNKKNEMAGARGTYGREKKCKWPEHEAHMGERRSVSRAPLGKSDGQKPLWTPRP